MGRCHSVIESPHKTISTNAELADRAIPCSANCRRTKALSVLQRRRTLDKGAEKDGLMANISVARNPLLLLYSMPLCLLRRYPWVDKHCHLSQRLAWTIACSLCYFPLHSLFQ